MDKRVAMLDGIDQVRVLAHPLRLEILRVLRTAQSAAAVARELGQSRQLVNHHVKTLAEAGLLRHAGEARTGNFVEQRYEAVAGSFVVSPRLSWGSADDRERALADQVSLEHLLRVGEQLQVDAATLLDRAAFDGEEIPSAAVSLDVPFADATARAAFMDEYLELLGALVDRHASAEGERFHIAAVIHPHVDHRDDLGTTRPEKEIP